MAPKFSIVIPAYNEANRIVNGINKIRDYFKNKKISYEIVAVNDGSRDSTLKILKDLARKYKELKVMGDNINRGKGYAVKTGILNSKGNYVLFTDADLSTPIGELYNMFKYIKTGYDVVIGSRNIDKSKVKLKQPFYRRFLGNLLRVYYNIIIFPRNPPSDSQCGFKLFTKKASVIFKYQKIYREMFDIEILYLARKFKFKVKEVPVVWVNDPDSKINLIKCVTYGSFDLLRIRLYDLLGKYKR
ncbi:glycosyltransferase family 2 protein [Candidatus Woesearchaeota archaeon]|nr:glycosyltransferase family 2 protein [Candidatus Woesearchaeota archaeon]